MNRITKKQLETRIDTLNSMTGQPMEPYAPVCRKDGGLMSNAGHYHLNWAYGGVGVDQMCSGGGARDILPLGTKRETYERLGSMIEGIRIGQKTAPPVHIVAAAPHDRNGNPRRVSVQVSGDRVVDTNDHGYSGPPRDYGPEALRVSVSATEYKGLLSLSE